MRGFFVIWALTVVSTVYASGVVYRVPVQGTIDLGLPPYVERVIEQAQQERPDVIIFDIDTFGGRIDGATRIKDAIMSSPVPTVAFVNRRAICGGYGGKEGQ
jgi:membrane-bound serine protease (ClpP class)